MDRLTVVVPTIRELAFARFISSWESTFKSVEARVIVVEDNPERTFAVPDWCEHYCWEDIDVELGSNAWIIPRRSDTVRDFGFLKALDSKCDIVWTLDDDCYPEAGRDYISELANAFCWDGERSAQHQYWWDTLAWSGQGLRARGYPYQIPPPIKSVDLHHGMWSNVPDFDAMTQLNYPDLRLPPAMKVQVVPHGKFFPMCGMNLAFKQEVIPAMYFPLMGAGQPFDRFGDIWAGVLFKPIADALLRTVTSGAPSVHHAKASDVWVNLRKEAPGYQPNEVLWQVALPSMQIESYAEGYRVMADRISEAKMPHATEEQQAYWRRLPLAMRTWAKIAEKKLNELEDKEEVE